MGEENSSNTMNLDLNLGPTDNSSEPPSSGSYMNLEDWLDGPPVNHRVREVGRHRNHRWRSLWRQLPIPPETRNLALELIGGGGEGEGEGSVPPSSELLKICENATGYVEEDEEGVGKKNKKKKDGGKNNGDEGSFFDCNICLDLAKDPVVTCCGHLFCWPCLYRWLHHHSDAKECPVCKGEVTTKNVTPIYGRANSNSNNNNNNVREADTDHPTVKIPIRPPARRVESWRQTIQRSAFSIPMEEMIRRLGSTFDLNRELAQLQSRSPDDESSPERSNTLLNRILTSRGMRRERGVDHDHHDDVIDLTESISPPRRFSSLLLRRSNSHRGAAENVSVVESYFQSQSNPPPPPPVERNLELPPPFPFPFPFDDRDSVSSIAAVIHSESQTVDNAIEIDSTVALSTSSSRRRNNNDASRISDVDSGDSRAPRRRRFN